MKNILTTIIYAFVATSFVIADDWVYYPGQFSVELSAFSQNFNYVSFEKIKKNAALSPNIPGQWHIDFSIPDEKRLPEAVKAREFGWLIVTNLDVMAETFQKMESGAELLTMTEFMLDFSDWVQNGKGAWNILLADRAYDIAGVGFGKLVFDMEFSIEKTDKIAERFSKTPPWNYAKKSIESLDFESGTDMFSKRVKSNNFNDLQKFWRDAVLVLYVENGYVKPDWAPPIRVNPAKKDVLKNKLFFGSLEKGNTMLNNPTTRIYWDTHINERMTLGFQSRTALKACDLYNFRKVVGFYPPPWKRSEESAKKFEEYKIEAAKRGVVPIKTENTINFDPLREAFKIAWDSVPSAKKHGLSYGRAITAYHEIDENRFYDYDTQEVVFQLEKEELQKKLNSNLP